MLYDSIIVGGGIAGLQAAIQLGRYEHEVLVIDAGYGRSTLCRSYHNLLGWPDGVSGEKLRQLGTIHAKKLGVNFYQDKVVDAQKSEEGFVVRTAKSDRSFRARTLLLATGLLDRFPELPGLIPCLGRSIYVCPDCDGYEVKDRRTVVIGSGDSGASMAKLLTYWTDRIVYINHEQKPVHPKRQQFLDSNGVESIAVPIRSIVEKDGHLQAVILEDGRKIEAERGFISFGGNHVYSELAHRLGAERMENGHVITDPRTKMTSVPNVWVAGDLAVHSEQVTIAMGEGTQAAIWMHKQLMKMGVGRRSKPGENSPPPPDRQSRRRHTRVRRLVIGRRIKSRKKVA